MTLKEHMPTEQDSARSSTTGPRVAVAFSRISSSMLTLLCSSFMFVWRWSVPYRSANRPVDPAYAAVWNTTLDDEATREALFSLLDDGKKEQSRLQMDEERIRSLIRDRFTKVSTGVAFGGNAQASKDGSLHTTGSVFSDTSSEALEEVPEAASIDLPDGPEEVWEEVPLQLRNLLAAMNARHIESQLDLLLDEYYHTKSGLSSMLRSRVGIRKTLKMWREGFSAGVGRREKYFVNFFFIPLLAFFACYPDIAAGFLHQRTYNLRSVGSKIASLCQLLSLSLFPYHSFWLLFNWSLERLIGAFVGNTIYALSAIVPQIRKLNNKNWFRLLVLGLSMSWQIGVQFSPVIRDYIVRLVTRRQMRKTSDRSDDEKDAWAEIRKKIQHQLTSHQSFVDKQLSGNTMSHDWRDVPFKTRTERFIHFTKTYDLGRPADQLVGLLKDELEGVVNTYEDYAIGMRLKATDQGHIEPRLPKFLLVFFDMAIFAYVCYSFYPQPFTFNTTVAYGTVCVIKQAVLAFKKYQTVKGARRVFTNMVAFNLLGVFLVSTPVTADPGILESDSKFAALLSAMVFATLFLAEPIAPLFLRATEAFCSGWTSMRRSYRRRKFEDAPA